MSLGEFLRQERESRGITIEQVASATKVGVRTLHLLEEDHYSELPAKPFVLGFVTSYCRFIGLDPKEVLARFDDYISRKTAERPNRESGHSGYVFEKKDGEQQGRTILMIAIVGFVVLGGLAMLFLKPSLHHHRRNHIDKLRAVHSGTDTETVISSPLPAGEGSQQAGAGSSSPASAALLALTPTPSPSIQSTVSLVPAVPAVPAASAAPTPATHMIEGIVPGNASPSPVSAGETEAAQSLPGTPGANPKDPLDSGAGTNPSEIHHKIVSKVLADIWVRYQVDERPIRKFIVRKGRTLLLKGKEKVWMQVSNPNSLSFKYNNHGAVLASKLPEAVLVRGVATLFFPKELSEKIEQMLIREKPLPSTPDPIPDEKSSSSTPSP